MKIQQLTLHNWRSIKDETINFQDMMIFIGQNNHGKSNVLYALLFFFGLIPLDNLDYNRDTNELFVEITFGDLDSDDKNTFKKYLTSDNTIRVRKQASFESSSEYHGYIETPSELWLREDNISDYVKRDVAETLPLAADLPSSGKITKEQFHSAQIKYIEEHKDQLTFSYELELAPFLGAKNVAKGIFGDVYFVPSVKKATDDLSVKSNSVFNELYSRIINKMSEANQEFREAKEKIGSLIQLLNKVNEDGTTNNSRPRELSTFEGTLEEELSTWDTTIDVEITAPDINEIFRLGTTVWVDDGVRTDISRKGQGLQRALIFALVRALAKIMKAERTSRESENPSNEEEPTSRSTSRLASKSTFFIFEEPELYLHPQAQRELYDSLFELSIGANQVIICTHSSSFISLDHYSSICCIRKDSIETGTTAFQCCEELFSDEEDRKKFNMTYWINPDRSEMFFARKVILVEGQTEKTIVPHIADSLNIFRHDYTLIDCGSKSAMPSYMLLLQKFSIPYVAVYDLDHQAYKLPDAIASADADSERINTIMDPALGKSIILINDIEEEIGITDRNNKHKPYIALTHIKDSGFTLTPTLEQKIRNIYA